MQCHTDQYMCGIASKEADLARGDPEMRIRLPHDVKRWLERQSKKNLRTQNAEIILAVRSRMAAGDGRQAQAPAAEID